MLDRLYRFFLTIIVVSVVIIIAISKFKGIVTDNVTKKAFEYAGISSDIEKKEMNKIMNILSKEERETFERIIKENSDNITNINKIKSIIKNRDINELKALLKSDIPEDDILELKEIYNNHIDDINKIMLLRS